MGNGIPQGPRLAIGGHEAGLPTEGRSRWTAMSHGAVLASPTTQAFRTIARDRIGHKAAPRLTKGVSLLMIWLVSLGLSAGTASFVSAVPSSAWQRPSQ